MEAVAAAAELLGCTEDALIQALTTKTRTVAGERIQSMIKVADAVISRDALARVRRDTRDTLRGCFS